MTFSPKCAIAQAYDLDLRSHQYATWVKWVLGKQVAMNPLSRSVTAEVQEVRRKMEESTQHRYKQRVMQAVTDKDVPHHVC
eukprot:6464898-Amphidinium_carterae.1